MADIGAYQVTHPDDDDLDQPPNPSESNPNGLALLPGGNVLVADAAANDLLQVDVHGRITTLAHFRPEFVPWGLPFGPPIGTIVPAEAVPTAVAVGPDGAYYVSELTGFPFAKGAARIWRIEAGSVEAVCDPVASHGGCSSFATGFSSVLDLTFGPDGTMYVLELAKNGLAGALVLGNEFPPIGALWAIKNGVRTLVDGALVAPGGVTVDANGIDLRDDAHVRSSRRFSAQPERLTLVRAGAPRSVGAPLLASSRSARRAGRPAHDEVERQRLDACRSRVAGQRLEEQLGAAAAALEERLAHGRQPA